MKNWHVYFLLLRVTKEEIDRLSELRHGLKEESKTFVRITELIVDTMKIMSLVKGLIDVEQMMKELKLNREEVKYYFNKYELGFPTVDAFLLTKDEEATTQNNKYDEYKTYMLDCKRLDRKLKRYYQKRKKEKK